MKLYSIFQLIHFFMYWVRATIVNHFNDYALRNVFATPRPCTNIFQSPLQVEHHRLAAYRLGTKMDWYRVTVNVILRHQKTASSGARGITWRRTRFMCPQLSTSVIWSNFADPVLRMRQTDPVWIVFQHAPSFLNVSAPFWFDIRFIVGELWILTALNWEPSC